MTKLRIVLDDKNFFLHNGFFVKMAIACPLYNRVNIYWKQQEGHSWVSAKPQVSASILQELWEEELVRAQNMEASG